MAVNLHDEVRSNQRRSIFIIIMFFVFVAGLGILGGFVFGLYRTGQPSIGFSIFGFVLAFVASLIYMGIFMSSGAKMVLKTTGAVEANRKTYPFLYHTTETLSIAAGMKTPPKCYVIKDSALNAFATGFKPENSYICVTTGLMEKLNRQELEGVLAHEMSHIKNQDIKVMLLAAGLVGAVVLLADFMFRMFLFSGHGGGNNDNKNGALIAIVIGFYVLIIILSPIIANMIKLAISRRREYLADSSGALLTRYPEGLASALEKIRNDPDPLVDKANKATAHLFISTPFRKKKPFLAGLFSTHPPIDDRIARLRGRKA